MVFRGHLRRGEASACVSMTILPGPVKLDRRSRFRTMGANGKIHLRAEACNRALPSEASRNQWLARMQMSVAETTQLRHGAHMPLRFPANKRLPRREP